MSDSELDDDAVGNGKIAALATGSVKLATSGAFDFWSGVGYGPGGSGAASATTRVFDLEFNLDPGEYRDGDRMVLFFDYDLLIDGAVFDWASLVEEIYRYGQSVSTPSSGATSSGKVQLLRSRNWLQGGTSGRILAPSAAISGNATIPLQRSGIRSDTLPSSGDGDYDATGYTYLLRVRSVASSLLSGSNAYENANDTSGQTFQVDDVDLVGVLVRQTGTT